MLHLRPLGDRQGDRKGHCSVCGGDARFVRNSWMLPTELARAWPEGFVDRESLLCSACGSSARVRGVADALVALYGTGGTSVADLVEEDAFRALRIAELNAIGRMHAVLGRLPNLTYAEYPEEDVMALSYADASFDLVLTSDTLEHVEDPMRGMREIRRVLRPGGCHVFTVPIKPDLATSRSRNGRRRSTTAVAAGRSRSSPARPTCWPTRTSAPTCPSGSTGPDSPARSSARGSTPSSSRGRSSS